MVVVPIVAPILLADPGANVTAVWLGVMIGLNMQTSFLTPPFGFALFYLRGVAPAIVKTIQIYKGVIAFIGLQLAALAIVGFFPPLVNYLPNRVSLLSETAPPPRNPKLQLCLEDYVSESLAKDASTTSAIEAAKALDLAALPKDLARDFSESVESAEKALTQLAAIKTASDAVAAASDDYKPQLTIVRGLEKQIRNREADIEQLTTEARRTQDMDDKVALEEEAEVLRKEVEGYRAQIPAEWEDAHTTFALLTKAEDTARNQYRRAADDAWEGAANVLAILRSGEGFAELETPLKDLRSLIETGAGEADADAIKAIEDMIGDVEGTGDIKKPLAKARREIDDDEPDREKAMEQYQAALDAYEAQQEWRAEAASIEPGVSAYVDGIRTSLGIRQQERLTRDQALAMARCTADHRDLSLNF